MAGESVLLVEDEPSSRTYLEQQLTGQDVERLLERVDVPCEPAAWQQAAGRQLRVDGALVPADQHPPRQAV